MYIMTERGWQPLVVKTEPETVIKVLNDKEASKMPWAKWSSAHQAFTVTEFAPVRIAQPGNKLLVQPAVTDKRLLERQPFE